jgi:hypothetical protein
METKEVDEENLVPMKFEFTSNPFGKPKRELCFSKLKEALHSISLNNIPVPRAQAVDNSGNKLARMSSKC